MKPTRAGRKKKGRSSGTLQLEQLLEVSLAVVLAGERGVVTQLEGAVTLLALHARLLGDEASVSFHLAVVVLLLVEDRRQRERPRPRSIFLFVCVEEDGPEVRYLVERHAVGVHALHGVDGLGADSTLGV